MAKEKVKPLIMSDGNIARHGMIVSFRRESEGRRNVSKITKLRTLVKDRSISITTDADSFDNPNWTCGARHIYKATEEEKKIYRKLKKNRL